MDELFYIKTENKHGQILVFTDRDAAVAWAKKATRWNDDYINQKVQTARKNALGFFSIF